MHMTDQHQRPTFAKGNRYRIAPECPCGKSNKDGKFSPLKTDSQAGYCHSCDQFFTSDSDTWQSSERTHIAQPTSLEYVPQAALDRTRTPDQLNIDPFTNWLVELFGDGIHATLDRYQYGAWSGKSYFWYIDQVGNILKAKVREYDGNGHGLSTTTAKKGKDSTERVVWWPPAE